MYGTLKVDTSTVCNVVSVAEACVSLAGDVGVLVDSTRVGEAPMDVMVGI